MLFSFANTLNNTNDAKIFSPKTLDFMNITKSKNYKI